MSQSDPVGRICKYVYSKDTPAVPDTELTVYSLTDDDFLRQAAAAFQKKYPDIYLNLETGMTGEDAVTETDALKALNTEIMAGKGPDILLMDGIAADTYIEKGMLEDLSGILKEKYPDIYLNLETGMTGEDAVTETDALKALNTEIMAGKGPDILLMDGIAADTYIEKGMLEDLSGILKDADILENIIEPYKDGEGKIYQMPVKFGIPYIQGKKEYVDAISDLTSMADTIESHKEEYTKDMLPFVSSYSPYMLLKGFSAVNMSAWVNEDGTLNQAAVQEHKEEYTKDMLPFVSSYSPYMLLKGFSAVNMSAWVNEDGTLNQAAVQEFLEQTNRIYQSAKAPAEEQLAAFGVTAEEMEEANEVRNLYSEYGAVFSQFGVGGLSLISESNILGTGGIYSPSDLRSIYSNEVRNLYSEYGAVFSQFGVGGLSLISESNILGTGGIYSPSDLRSIYSVEQQGDGISGKLWNGQTKDAFIPQKIVGISAKSSEKEAAEQFVGYLFSDEGQRVSTTSGLPVRKSVYEDVSYWMGNAKEGDVTSVASSYNNQTGESVDLSIVQPGESVIKEMQELGKTLTAPVKENRQKKEMLLLLQAAITIRQAKVLT